MTIMVADIEYMKSLYKEPAPWVFTAEFLYWDWRHTYHPFYKRRHRRMAGK